MITVNVGSLIIKYLISVWSLIEFPWTLWVPLFRVSWDIVRQFRLGWAHYQPISQTPNITERLKLLLYFSSAKTNRIQTANTGDRTRPPELVLLDKSEDWQQMQTQARIRQDRVTPPRSFQSKTSPERSLVLFLFLFANSNAW